ncbi:MAG TPA: hypothetical protein VJ725_34155 [Thermoanaerobaculia bacterium]|nr:hypothetical protein [Thermoanaerobaculia bacterium]
MEKVPCIQCGNLILPRTVEKTGGLCMPCKNGAMRCPCSRCGKLTFVSRQPIQPILCSICYNQERPTEIDEFIRKHGGGDCSLLSRLYRLDERLRRERKDAWIGLNLMDPPERSESDSAPRNSIAFAEVGVDYVHFNLISWRGRVSDDSAVVLTFSGGDEPASEQNLLVGQSLYEFLCLGARAGFAPLGDLPYHWDKAIEELENDPVLDEAGKDEREVLRIYREELQLKPWPRVRERLEELQRLRKTLLRF